MAFKPSRIFIIIAIFIAVTLSVIFFFPKLGLLKKTCATCDDYSNFVMSLSADQKSKLALLESGVINVENKYIWFSSI
jgi:hypothetical protein